MHGAIFGHDEDILAFQDRSGGERIRYLDGHDEAFLDPFTETTCYISL